MTEPHIEMFTLPPLEDVEYWEKFIAAGLHQPEPPPPANNNNGYTWVDLASPQYATPPDPPAIEGILYAGRRHVISGPPESLKTLVAYMLLLSALRANQGVCILDFEMGPHAAATLLRELGATEEELQAIHYTEPQGPPTSPDIERIIGLGVGYVVVDAAVGAYDASGLEDMGRKDVEIFAGTWIRPLWKAGIATILIDHVTKDANTRGKFAIGSERKIGQADVHLGLEALKPLHRGGTGMVKINVHKDRPGHLPRPTVHVVDLESDTEHNITWTLREPIVATETGDFRHTIYMERVSRYMQQNPDHLYSKNELEEGVEGKRDHIRTALQELIDDEHVLAVEHGKWLKYHLVRPFAPSSPQFAPGEPEPNLAPFAPPLQGAKGEGRTSGGEPNQSSPRANLDVYDPEIQKLLDKEIPF